MRNKILIQWLTPLALLILGGVLPVQGQISYQASFHQGAGNPGGVNTESDFETAGWSTLMGPSLMVNQWSNPGNIPFPFKFFGKTVNFFKASANGVITFDMTSPSPPGNNGLLPHPSVPDSSILCFWEEFTTNPPLGSNDRVETKVFGTAPNRQLWIRYHSYEWGPCSFAYLAVVLEETSNKVYVVDLFSSLNANLVTATVGIQANPSFAITAAANVPLAGLTSVNGDNNYYTFTPYQIEPYDMVAVSIESPKGDACGLGMESVTIKASNVGLFTATGMTAKFSVNGGPFLTPETIPGSLAPGDTLQYTFSALANLSAIGSHTIRVVVDVAGDNNALNDSMSTNVNNLINITTFPYQENFENGAGGWTPGGTNSSWQMGYANNPTIKGAASGVNTWITGRTGSYNSNEDSWVLSPCFDMSGLGPSAAISMNVWWETEFSWDGAVLQSSQDGGQSWQRVGAYGDPNNWYNDASINAMPGNQLHGWTGQANGGTGSGGWVKAQAPLDPSLIGASQVLFRVAFGSDASSNLDGFAFDDVTIGNAPVVNLGPGGFFCQGAQLDVGSSNYNHQILWSNGATTPKITLQNPFQSAIIDSMVTVEITNSIGLVARDTVIFSMTRPPTVEVVNITNVTCHGGATGEIVIKMVGGASPFVYAWSHGATVQNPTQLSQGTYTGLVTDINGCKANIPAITVNQNAPLNATASIREVSCYGESDGRITLHTTGGVMPYQINWNVGGTGDTLAGLSIGTYFATITDQVGCVFLDSITMTQPDSMIFLSAEVVNATCIDASDGSVLVTLSGGTIPYTFFWGNGTNGEVVDSLSVGSVSGYVADSRGCLLTLPSFEITYADSIPEAGFGIDISGGRVTFLDSSLRAAKYFWDFGDGNTSEERRPSHLYEENGTFSVIQVVSNLCGADTAVQEVSIIAASVDQPLASPIQLYPNPTTGIIHVEMGPSWTGSGKAALYDASGQLVWSQPIEIFPGDRLTLRLPATLARGMYLLSVTQQNRATQKKLEIR